MRNIWSHDSLFYAIIDDDDNEMAPEDVVNELTTLRAENARLAAEIEQLKRELHIATGSRQALALELQIVQAQLEQA